MATPAEPATSAIFRALRSVDVDPDLAYEAAEESRRQAGENVIAAIGAKIDSQSARIDVKFSQIESQITEVRAEIKAQNSRIDVLQRVIWPLIGLLATTVFGLLYRVVIASGLGEFTEIPPKPGPRTYENGGTPVGKNPLSPRPATRCSRGKRGILGRVDGSKSAVKRLWKGLDEFLERELFGLSPRPEEVS